MSLYEGAVKKPIMTSLCFLAVVIFGLFSLSKLPIDLYPDIDTNTIMVLTAYPGASASDIENNVTRPLENSLNSVSNLKHIMSRSSENMSLITLEFEFGNDIDVITNDVRDKLDMVRSQLPDAVDNPVIFKFSTDMIPIVILSVQANESQAALYKILDDRVVNPLARIPGVGTVSISGAPKREIQVYCDPNKLEAYRLTVESISAVIGAENKNIPGGNFDIGSDTYSLRVEGEFKDARQLENIVVGTHNGANVFLRDVAKVADTVKERAQETYNNGVKGAMIVIQKQSGANSVDISKKVAEVLPRLQKSLPSDVKLGMIVDTSDNILNTIDSLAETVMYALLFVVLVVFLFLGRWRATLIICITIPLSLIASFIYLAITGNSINIISLSSLSIAIGMVVDDAIVVLENVTTHIERGSDPKQAAIHGTNEVAISVVASTLTMIAVFFPLTMVSGMSGVLFKQLGWMMCVIMLVSTMSALSLTPMLCSQLLRLQKKQTRLFTLFFTPVEKALDKLDTGYAKMLNWAVRHRTVVIMGCIAFFVLSLFSMKGIGTEFFPAQDNARISINLELPVGARKEMAQELAERLTKQWLTKYEGILVVCNYTVGQADSDNTWASMQSNGSHIISFNMRLVDPGERDITLEQVCDEMREDLKAYPELDKARVILGGSNSGMAAQASADFEVYGYDMAMTDSVSARLKRALLQVKGVSEVNISRSDYLPEYQVDFDREKLAMHGLNLSTAGMAVRNRINGSVASKYREDGEEYDIKVRNAPEFRTTLEDIENILIYNSRGEPVRVKDLGKVVERFAPPTIERKDRERIVTVSAIISGAPLGNVVKAGNAIIDKMDIPAGVSIQVAGSYEDQQDSFRDLGTLGLLIIILVFIVMAAQFESLTYPFIIMFSLPFAFSGVLMALFFTGSTLSVMSLLGSIMLIGIVVKNGIVLIEYISLCRERGMAVLNAVVTSGKSRLRPVLMTTATTVLGMIPMAVGGGQGSEMWSPMAIAVIGGLTVSTVLTLILIPTLYSVFAGVGIRNQRRKLRNQQVLNAYFEESKA
ncbi:efflux RND transporter permease subunit [Bacteroides pyogenes]|uniref:efflux RND transporter permease subunit n=1 Tax=Bacteroides pyogenes TaxID=310300 RepID=UPI00055227AC|nr:efflux RND transporter permease subunit [Bacteroides pyogenes]MBB3895743.1 HAE1 family hydrophobic/amphiphilic exporter-1 [Bacteroides pyogenes]SUV31394.1 putative transmembrane Acr-type transport protein [Bacteroides pyogenes]